MNEPQAEMPRYQSHKTAWALRIRDLKPRIPDDGTLLLTPDEDGYAPFVLDAAYVAKHKPEAGGYYVVYEDGYKSFSPAKAFEDGYTKIPATTTARKLTSHIVNGLNECIEIQVLDAPGSGGANHHYRLCGVQGPLDHHPIQDAEIRFQNGPINEVGANGLSNESLLAIVEDRLRGFQSGQFACRENALALTHLQEAMHWLHHRTRERVQRGVEGTHMK